MNGESKWKKRISLFVGLGVLASGLFLAWMFVQGGHFRIRTLRLELTGATLTPEVKKRYQGLLTAELAALHGRNIFSVGASEISNVLTKKDWIDSAQVSRRIPDEVVVRIRAKPVAAVAIVDRRNSVLVAEDAGLFPAIPISEAPDVPLLRQQEFARNLELRKRAMDVLKSLPVEGNLSRESVSEIAVDSQKNLWLSLVESDLKVRLGSESIPLQAARVAKVLDYLNQNNLQARVIDADYSKKVVVKLRKAR